ncbi:hypothetical protein tloyanaT_14820 [Thalassotalea loyana]|uniref:YnhF family membrane protein n=1 Tax=Thalassotalea loyana TaxID=280483 RepID=A0ABQ6HAS4_9GAMM|nr:hypothetical protein tloyanaT_14820 [Thalassotalea loyana]
METRSDSVKMIAIYLFSAVISLVVFQMMAI